MESKSILVGIIIGIIVGSAIGFLAAPSPDVSGLESWIALLEQQVSDLQDEKSALQASLQEKESETLTLTDHISQLEGKITDLKAQAQNLASQDDFTFVDISFSRTNDTSSLLQYWIGRANETIRVMIYLITQDELTDALIEAHQRGVDVDVVIDDDWLYVSGSDYQEILDAGVDIRGDDRAGLMHHKVMVIDGHVVVTGSYNWSGAAEDSNDEDALILKSLSIAQAYLEEFNRIWSQTSPEKPVEAPTEAPGVGPVVINEVELNPYGTDAGYEWVELYNPINQSVDIGGWMLETTHGETVTLMIEYGTVIEPGEFQVYSHNVQWLDNEGESVLLMDESYSVVDETPLLTDTENDIGAWARYPDGYDTDDAFDWVFQASTQGSPNS